MHSFLRSGGRGRGERATLRRAGRSGASRRNPPKRSPTPRPRPERSPQGRGFILSLKRRPAQTPPGSDRRERRGGRSVATGGTGARAYARWEAKASAASRTAEPPHPQTKCGRRGREVAPPKGGSPSGRITHANKCRPTTPHAPKPRPSSGGEVRGGDPRGGPRRRVFRARRDPEQHCVAHWQGGRVADAAARRPLPRCPLSVTPLPVTRYKMTA